MFPGKLVPLRYQIQTAANLSRRWSSGMILACHAGDPGSNPGRRKFFIHFFKNLLLRK